jgi:hypothetical protein
MVLFSMLLLLAALSSKGVNGTNDSAPSENASFSLLNQSNEPPACIDCDHDGFVWPFDCNDNDSNIHPNATETAYDGIDQDCDGFDLADVDMDGFCKLGYLIQNCTRQCPKEVGSVGADCRDNDSNLRPDAQEIFKNGMDDDCNASTPDSLVFRFSTNKQQYFLSESGTFTINAPPCANVYVTITTPTSRHNSILSFAGPYPLTQNIPYLRRVGNYSLDAVATYLNYSNSTAVNLVVENTLTAMIDSASRVQIGAALSLNALASGGLGSLTYLWSFGDGSQATGAAASHYYNVPGYYKVSVAVNDSEQNSVTVAKTVEVSEKFTFKATVRNATSVIRNARVKFNGAEEYTNSDGLATFGSMSRAVYHLDVHHSGYYDYDQDINLTSNLSMTVQLNRTDSSTPSIVLLGPNDGQQFDSAPVTVRFSAFDTSTMQCVLYLSFDNVWWSKESVYESVQSNVEKNYVFNSLSPGTYWWKVRCEDSSANADFSQVLKFVIRPVASSGSSSNQEVNQQTLDEQQAVQAQDDELIRQIDASLDMLSKLPSREQEAVRLMQLDQEITKAKRNIQNYNRDLFNVRYRKLNESGRLELTDEISRNLELEKKKIVTNVQVLDSSNFVKYLSQEEIVSAASLLSSANLSGVSAKGLARLQTMATVSAEVMVVKLEYLFADARTVTVVQKDVKIANSSGIAGIAEIVPKDIASNADELSVRGEFQILQKDPILKFGSNQSTTIYYSVGREISPSKLEKTLTLVLPNGVTEQPAELITGFAIGSLLKNTVSNTIYLVALAVVIASFTGLAYFWDGILQHLPVKTSEEVRRINSLSGRIDLCLKGQDLETAKKLYQDIKEIYKQMNPKVKSKVGSGVLGLYHRLQLADLMTTAKWIEGCCEQSDYQKATLFYQRLNQIYSALPKQFKERALDKCLEVRKKLNEKK